MGKKIRWLLLACLIVGAIIFNRERLNQAIRQSTTNKGQIGTVAPVNSRTVVYDWHYKTKSYQLKLAMSPELFQDYQSSSHDYEFKGELPPNWREEYYAMFLRAKPSDKIVESIVNQLRQQAAANNLSADELAQLAIAFVQSIPYDQVKAGNKQASIDYAYEILYKQTGICSDKVILAMAILRELGYGTAWLSFPDHNHAAAGIECPADYALPGTTYCYIETTDFFPLGFIPQVFDPSGLAVKQADEQTAARLNTVFNSSVLGQMEIFQTTHGRVYQAIAATRQAIVQLNAYQSLLASIRQELTGWKQKIDSQQAQVDQLAAQMEKYKRQNNYAAYNKLVEDYNGLVRSFNDLVENYKLKTESYNQTVGNYDRTLDTLYVAGK